jgi:hypothetical protein
MKQTLKIGITLVVVTALAMSGIALAAQGDDTPVDVTETPAYSRILDTLQPLVDDGTLDGDDAAAVAELLAGELRHGHGQRAFKGLAAVADFLGLDADEMRAAIEEYETIAAIAEANGSSAEAVIDHLLSLCEDRLDTAVENGRITEDEKAEMLADAEERITEMVNNPLPEPGDRPMRGRRGGFGSGDGFGSGGGFGPGDGSGPIHDIDA